MRYTVLLKTAAVAALLLIGSDALAAGSGSYGSDGEAEFGGYFDMLAGWISGTMGATITVISLIVTLIMALRGSLIASLSTLGIAILAVLGPPTIETIFSYALPLSGLSG